MRKLGILILAGGQSKRMGEDKAFLPWSDTPDNTLLQYRLEDAIKHGFTDIYISSNKVKEVQEICHRVIQDNYANANITIKIIEDEFIGQGPLGAVASCLPKLDSSLSHCLVVAIDMPFLDLDNLLKRLWHREEHFWIDNYSNSACVAEYSGKNQPLASIYTRDCGSVAHQLLAQGEHRMNTFLQALKCKRVDFSDSSHQFLNLNTPLEYKLARAQYLNSKRKIPIISIVAAKSKIGKTTFIEGLIKAFKGLGVRVGFVKSDGHGFSMDTLGTDTYKAKQAGATAIAIAGPKQWAIIQDCEQKKNLRSLVEQLDVDLAIIESRSHGVFPLIEVIRSGYSVDIISNKREVVGLVDLSYDLVATDDKDHMCIDNAIKYFGNSSYENIAKWIKTNLMVGDKTE